MGESEAAATGMWVHGGTQDGYWDDGVMEIVAGSREEGRKIRGWLGEVDLLGGKRIGSVSKYLGDRYGFDPGKDSSPAAPLRKSNPYTVFRNDGHSIHLGLSFNIPFPLPFTVRRSSLLWTYGRHANTSATLPPHAFI